MVMTTEVLRNMIHAGARVSLPRLRGARRGALPRGPLSWRCLGGGHPRGAGRGGARVPVGHGGECGRVGRLDHSGPGQHRHRRRTADRSSCGTCSPSATGPTSVPSSCRPSSTDSQTRSDRARRDDAPQLPGRGDRHARTCAPAGQGSPGARQAGPDLRPVGPRWSSGWPRRTCCPSSASSSPGPAARTPSALPRRRRPPQFDGRAPAGARDRRVTRRNARDDDLDVLGYGRFVAGLEAGIAAHHAGMVPPFREAVEACFAEALVKVVFATETLALGINMPARSVVIEELSKYTGAGHAELTAGEYTQLTGRAGRRGIDDVGYAVVLASPLPHLRGGGEAGGRHRDGPSRRPSGRRTTWRSTWSGGHRGRGLSSRRRLRSPSTCPRTISGSSSMPSSTCSVPAVTCVVGR